MSTEATTTPQLQDLPCRTPDQLVDFISAAAHGLVLKVNAGQTYSEELYNQTFVRTFDALTARLIAHPDQAFADRVRRTLLQAQHRLPAETRTRLRGAQP